MACPGARERERHPWIYMEQAPKGGRRVRGITWFLARVTQPRSLATSNNVNNTNHPIVYPMAAINYKPFSGPQEFSSLMPWLFSLYARGPDDQLSFRFLQRTLDLRVICKESTAEDVDFPTSPALENAIQNSADINSPETSAYPPVRDSAWATWLEGTISDLTSEIGVPRGEHP